MRDEGLQPIGKSLPKQKNSKTVSPNPSGELAIEPECPICKDIGVHYLVSEDGKANFSYVVICECRKEAVEQSRRDRLIRLCELPYGTEKLTFDSFKVDNRWPSLNEAKTAAMELADEASDFQWLILLGEVDCGKTHLAIAICRRWLERGMPARYVLVPTMLDELRIGYKQEGEDSYANQIDFLKRVDLLVLDDLGTQVPTPWAMEKLMMIIDHRSVNGLPMVVTTNKDPRNLPGDDEHRIGSRLLRFTAGRQVVIEAPEYRTWRK